MQAYKTKSDNTSYVSMAISLLIFHLTVSVYRSNINKLIFIHVKISQHPCSQIARGIKVHRG